MRLLPSPVYFYGMAPGLSFTLPSVPACLLGDLLAEPVASDAGTEDVSVSVTLDRVAPLKKGHRDLFFTLRVQGGPSQVQVAKVKDSTGAFVFDGLMADAKETGQLGSPMPGVVEKVITAVHYIPDTTLYTALSLV